jgi:hypothetical protein
MHADARGLQQDRLIPFQRSQTSAVWQLRGSRAGHFIFRDDVSRYSGVEMSVERMFKAHSEAAHAAKNAGLVKESNRAL